MRGKFLIGLFLCVFLVGCIEVPSGAHVVDTEVIIYDVTEHDVYTLFDQNLITADQVTVKGVGLGDNLLEVLRAFDSESFIEQYPAYNITNVRFWDAETNRTTVIFHLVNGRVERIAIKEGMRSQLVGRTAEPINQANITLSFGKPDKSEDIAPFRVYTYSDKGLEIYHRRKKMFGFGLIRPT